MTNTPQYPSNHRAAMRVTKGGSCCANCKFWDGDDCENGYYRKWNDGSGEIPVPPDEFCSDWWEPKENKKTVKLRVKIPPKIE